MKGIDHGNNHRGKCRGPSTLIPSFQVIFRRPRELTTIETHSEAANQLLAFARE